MLKKIEALSTQGPVKLGRMVGEFSCGPCWQMRCYSGSTVRQSSRAQAFRELELQQMGVLASISGSRGADSSS